MKKLIGFKNGSGIYGLAKKDKEDDYFLTPAISFITPSLTYNRVGVKAWFIGIRFLSLDLAIGFIGQDKVQRVKKMNIKEFVEEGYLQESNRRFFHPLGLALEVQADNNGDYSISGVQDFRKFPEGAIFDLVNSDHERKRRFFSNFNKIEKAFSERAKIRKDNYGYELETIPPVSDEETKK